jgi:hypothetical protein
MRIMLHRTLAIALLAALVSACSDTTGVVRDGVGVTMDGTGLRIHNARDEKIYIFALEANTAAVSLWGPCSNPTTCEAIEPGATEQLPRERIGGWGNSDTVILWWWHLVPATQGSFKPDSIRAIQAHPDN